MEPRAPPPAFAPSVVPPTPSATAADGRQGSPWEERQSPGHPLNSNSFGPGCAQPRAAPPPGSGTRGDAGARDAPAHAQQARLPKAESFGPGSGQLSGAPPPLEPAHARGGGAHHPPPRPVAPWEAMADPSHPSHARGGSPFVAALRHAVPPTPSTGGRAREPPPWELPAHAHAHAHRRCGSGGGGARDWEASWDHVPRTVVPASPTALSVASTCTSASYNPIHDALDEAALRRAENAPSLEGVLANNVVDRIFLGDIVAAASRDGLQNQRITHIVNLAGSANFFEDDDTGSSAGGKCKVWPPKYLRIWIRDSPDECISRHFKRCNEFVDRALASHQDARVLFHCQAGASRSTTVCVAYLMYRHRWTLDHTWALVVSKHKAANPNNGFRRQLIDLNTVLHGSPQGTEKFQDQLAQGVKMSRAQEDVAPLLRNVVMARLRLQHAAELGVAGNRPADVLRVHWRNYLRVHDAATDGTQHCVREAAAALQHALAQDESSAQMVMDQALEAVLVDHKKPNGVKALLDFCVESSRASPSLPSHLTISTRKFLAVDGTASVAMQSEGWEMLAGSLLASLVGSNMLGLELVKGSCLGRDDLELLLAECLRVLQTGEMVQSEPTLFAAA
eukprot:CAMPEP_0114250168 /NCGR_PEP_ID=MMETSP0058-20121206/14552_1 /TAXON_ID=36894 /ORGANISM="Pyramimonas parkeae, CCMP726" /LENGTH=620 /DNA_ID=CAMNT_0001363803 /DNA_START=331 /DNA_END=2192 /DNA_ORIENTATION=-